MENFKKIVLALIIIVVLVILYGAIYGVPKSLSDNNKNNVENIETSNVDPGEQLFLSDELETDTSLKSIDLELVFNGGPRKDGIPSIDEPKFISVKKALDIEPGDRNGIVISYDDEVKFYPYTVLVQHEIVNDEIAEMPVLVTFCPLCGSAIVFNPVLDGVKREFGVSGKLYQSNLLMYDRVNESLWSQSIGEAVVGTDLGTKLEILPSQVLTFSEFSEKYPKGKVLSRDTGHFRDYNFYPYGDYNTNNRLIFPVEIEDKRLPTKEIMYIVNIGEKSVAFHRANLTDAGTGNVDVDGERITATVDGGEIEVTNSSGSIIPGYHEMWFSWATHHQDNGIVWIENGIEE